MFDIGFSELLVIAVVALIVIGPERLPKVARTLGHLFGRMQRYVNDVKADISREMELDELRKLQSNVEDAARAIQGSVEKEVNETRSELDKVAQAANPNPAPDYPELPAAPRRRGLRGNGCRAGRAAARPCARRKRPAAGAETERERWLRHGCPRVRVTASAEPVVSSVTSVACRVRVTPHEACRKIPLSPI